MGSIDQALEIIKRGTEEILLEELTEWKRERDQVDDVLVIGIRI